LVEGFVDAGVDVVDIGKITTDMLYFAVGAYDYSGGIVVSASHNPKQYNGMKLVREKVTAISSDTGLFDIRDVLKGRKRRGSHFGQRKDPVTERDILDDYLRHVLKSIDTGSVKRFRFVRQRKFRLRVASVLRNSSRI
jgi:phosphomannomutase